MDNVLFRPAALEDALAVSEVYLGARKQFITYAPLVHTDENVRRWIAGYLIPRTAVIVAVQSDQIIGMMSLTHDGTTGWVDQLYIHPYHVGLGIGSQFIERAKGKLGSPIRLNTFQANTGARRFYERHGFKALKLNDGSNNEEKCPDVLYEWRA